ncbi:hypothetical protein QUB80_05490 [Chlorogloeopsis sp. ULAP01]|nr:hypothetical protein [Chlorogloeopsis sp. ULAP01]MDM9380152.1 hypothetical protein [Chlorogloeopsis sp. ULAP01]
MHNGSTRNYVETNRLSVAIAVTTPPTQANIDKLLGGGLIVLKL